MKSLSISLRKKALLSIGLILLPIILTFFYEYNRNKKYVKEGVLSDLTVISEAYEGQVYQFLEMSKRRVQDFSSDGIIRSGLQDILNGRKSEARSLSEYLSHNKQILDKTIHSINILSLDGMVLASTDGSLTGRDFSGETFFLKGKGGLAVADYITGTSDQPRIAVSAPLFSRNTGRPIGVISNFILLSELNRILNRGHHEENGAISWDKGRRKSMEVYLVNEDGMMLTESRFVKNTALGQRVNTFPVTECMNSKKEFTGIYKNYREVNVAGASACLPEMKWTLLTEVDSDEVLAPVTGMWIDTLIAGGFVVSLIGALFLLFTRNVVNPLKKISIAAKEIAKGNYGITVPVETSDEIENLADSFNKMSNDIKDRTVLLRESEERLRTIMDNSVAVIYLKDADGRYITINRRFEDLFGVTREDVKGRSDHDIFPKAAADTFRANDLEVLKTKKPVQFEEDAPHEDGMHHYISVKVPILDSAGVPVAVCGISTDITERKVLEEQLLQSQKMESVGRLAGGIAHDFNNILTAIIGYGNLLIIKRKDDDLAKSYADNILVLSNKAAKLTQGLLAYSRKQVITLKPADLNGIIERVVDILIKRLIGENIELRTNLINKKLTVKVDPIQIEQVLMNLATNAKDAMPETGIIFISTDISKIDERFIKTHGYGEVGYYALLSFEDTGTGMDATTKKRLFEPFFTTKEVGKGTGLGLSIVYGIVKQHNGFINVYSEHGRGTTVRIYLPLIDAVTEEINHSEHRSLEGNKGTILLAEDEEDVRKVMKIVLEESGYKVTEAVNGEEALNKFIENREGIDLIVLDMVMPRKNGREAYEEMRKTRPGIKVLLMSGYSEDMVSAGGVLDEGVVFISKPIAPTEFLNKIKEVMGK